MKLISSSDSLRSDHFICSRVQRTQAAALSNLESEILVLLILCVLLLGPQQASSKSEKVKTRPVAQANKKVKASPALARVYSAIGDNSVNGFQVIRFPASGHPLKSLGVKPGDIVVAVNSLPIFDHQTAQSAYNKKKVFSVNIIRKGKKSRLVRKY